MHISFLSRPSRRIASQPATFTEEEPDLFQELMAVLPVHSHHKCHKSASAISVDDRTCPKYRQISPRTHEAAVAVHVLARGQGREEKEGGHEVWEVFRTLR